MEEEAKNTVQSEPEVQAQEASQPETTAGTVHESDSPPPEPAAELEKQAKEEAEVVQQELPEESTEETESAEAPAETSEAEAQGDTGAVDEPEADGSDEGDSGESPSDGKKDVMYRSYPPSKRLGLIER